MIHKLPSGSAPGLPEHCLHLFYVLLFVVIDFIDFPRKVLALLGESNGFLQKVMVLFNLGAAFIHISKREAEE